MFLRTIKHRRSSLKTKVIISCVQNGKEKLLRKLPSREHAVAVDGSADASLVCIFDAYIKGIPGLPRKEISLV